MKIFPWTLILVFVFFSCRRDKSGKPLSDFRFDDIFGRYKNDSSTIYALQACGWRYGGYKTDSFIKLWFKDHKQAKVYPVLSMTFPDTPPETYIYCWIIEGADTINSYLVRNGSIAGSLMVWNKKDFEPTYSIDSSPKTEYKVFIDGDACNAFYRQMISTDSFARKNNYGIWANGEDWYEKERGRNVKE